MRRASRHSWVGVVPASAAILLACTCPPSAAAAEPFLAVRLMGGQGWSCELADIQRLTCDGAALQVVTAGGTDTYALESIGRIDFNLDAWTGIEDPELAQDVVGTLHLSQNRPNPFGPETRIAFDLPQDGRAELRIYAVNGRFVRTLVEEERSAGPQSVLWDGLDDAGRPVSSGVYLYTLSAPGVEEGRKMLLVR